MATSVVPNLLSHWLSFVSAAYLGVQLGILHLLLSNCLAVVAASCLTVRCYLHFELKFIMFPAICQKVAKCRQSALLER